MTPKFGVGDYVISFGRNYRIQAQVQMIHPADRVSRQFYTIKLRWGELRLEREDYMEHDTLRTLAAI